MKPAMVAMPQELAYGLGGGAVIWLIGQTIRTGCVK